MGTPFSDADADEATRTAFDAMDGTDAMMNFERAMSVPSQAVVADPQQQTAQVKRDVFSQRLKTIATMTEV